MLLRKQKIQKQKQWTVYMIQKLHQYKKKDKEVNRQQQLCNIKKGINK